MQKASDLCSTELYTKTTGDRRRSASDYLIKRLGYIAKGSKFEQSLGILKNTLKYGIVNNVALRVLQSRGYDALVLFYQQDPVGISAFQKRGDDLHVFDIEVERGYRSAGLATYMQKELIKEAKIMNVQRIRIGGGGNEATNHLHQKLKEAEEELCIKVESENWIRII